MGGLTVAGIFEALKPNYAWAQQVAKDDKRIVTSYETVPSPQGNGSIRGYLAKPAAAGKYPAVLVVHENRGLNPYIEDVARRLATSDFVAFAPDAANHAPCGEALCQQFMRKIDWHAAQRATPFKTFAEILRLR